MNRDFPPALAFVLFLIFRFIAAFWLNVGDGVTQYLQYSNLVRSLSIAEFHRQANPAVEYPTLSIVWMTAAGMIADHLPQSAEKWISHHTTPAVSSADARYQVAYMFVMFFVDCLLFLIVYRLIRQLYPSEPTGFRLVVYAVTGGVFAPLLYDRLDLLVGFFALVVIFAFRKGHIICVYFILTLGTAFKLVPILLFPVFIVAESVIRLPMNSKLRNIFLAILKQSLVAALIFLVWPLLAYFLCGGASAFGFWGYHSDRGIQIESIFAWPVLLAYPETQVINVYTSHTLQSRSADAIAKVIPIITLFSLIAAGLISFAEIRRVRNRLDGDGRTFHQLITPTLILSCLLVWLAFIMSNKVSSVQYAIWLVPLIPLIPKRHAQDDWIMKLFCLMCIVFVVVYPGRYHDVTGANLGGEPMLFAGPTYFGYILLILRTLSITLLTSLVAHRVWTTR